MQPRTRVISVSLADLAKGVYRYTVVYDLRPLFFSTRPHERDIQTHPLVRHASVRRLPLTNNEDDEEGYVTSNEHRGDDCFCEECHEWVTNVRPIVYFTPSSQDRLREKPQRQEGENRRHVLTGRYPPLMWQRTAMDLCVEWRNARKV